MKDGAGSKPPVLTPATAWHCSRGHSPERGGGNTGCSSIQGSTEKELTQLGLKKHAIGKLY